MVRDEYIKYLESEIEWWKTQYYEKVGDKYFAEIEEQRNNQNDKAESLLDCMNDIKHLSDSILNK